MIATVSPSSSNCEHTINTLRYADRVKELKGPSNLGSEEFKEIREIPSPIADKPIRQPSHSTIPVRSSFILPPEPQPRDSLDEDLMINDEELDSLMKESSSPLKLTESDDSFLLSTFHSSQQQQQAGTKSTSKLKESLHHSIAVLSDRVSNCGDADLLELLKDELEGLLAAFNK